MKNINLSEKDINMIIVSLISYKCELESYDYKCECDDEFIKRIEELLIKFNNYR